MKILYELLNDINQSYGSNLLIFYTYAISIIVALSFPKIFYKWVCLPINWLSCTLFIFLRFITDVSLFVSNNITANILLGLSLVLIHPLFYVTLINNLIYNVCDKFIIAFLYTLFPILYIIVYYFCINNQSYTINDVMYIVNIILYPIYMLIASLVVNKIEKLNNDYDYDEIEY